MFAFRRDAQHQVENRAMVTTDIDAIGPALQHPLHYTLGLRVIEPAAVRWRAEVFGRDAKGAVNGAWFFKRRAEDPLLYELFHLRTTILLALNPGGF
jgi:hypothetical protein